MAADPSGPTSPTATSGSRPARPLVSVAVAVAGEDDDVRARRRRPSSSAGQSLSSVTHHLAGKSPSGSSRQPGGDLNPVPRWFVGRGRNRGCQGAPTALSGDTNLRDSVEVAETLAFSLCS